MIQLYAALLFNAHLKGFIKGDIYTGKAKYACVPGLNCYSCPGAVGACPLGALQNALASSGHRAGFYMLGIIMLYGVILGRTICGWLCPMGFVQELLHKIPTFKIRKNTVTQALSWLKYVILAVFVIAIPLWYGLKHDLPMPGFCKYICPAGTAEGAVGLLSNPANEGKFSLLGILFTNKFTIMIVIGLACVFCYRSFCRFVCPLGAIFGLFNCFNLIGVKVDADRCNHCGACVRSCGMDVRRVGDHECIGCGKCMDVCHQKAITIRAGSVILKAPEGGLPGDAPDAQQRRTGRGRILWGVALAVLCCALLWFNILDPSVRKQTGTADTTSADAVSYQEKDIPPGSAEMAGTTASEDLTEELSETTSEAAAPDQPVGHEVSMQLEDFTIECFDGSKFHLQDCLGKVTIINLWATYCTPCVQELEHFNELYKAHEDDIAMLAVHSSLVTDDPAAYAEGKGWEMPLAVDTPDDMIWKIVGGSTTIPQTIVLDRNGIVIYNETRSITPEMLQELYNKAGAQP